MTNDLHQQAKTIFNSLLDVNDDLRSVKLDELSLHSPELAQEVKSLLEYHTAQSLVVPPPSRRIRTRSTLSTTYRTRSINWAYAPLRGMLLAIPLFLLGIGIAIWADGQVTNILQASIANVLNETLENRLLELRQWQRQQLELALMCSHDYEVSANIQTLVSLSKNFDADESKLGTQLAASSAAKQLSQRLHELIDPTADFTVWDRRMLVVAHLPSDASAELGEFAPPSTASMLAPVIKGTPHFVLPHISESTSNHEEPEWSTSSAAVLVPVAPADTNSAIAVLRIRYATSNETYAAMLRSWNAKTEGETYLLNQRGAMLTPSRYGSQLAGFDIAHESPGKTGAFLVRDPGVDLLHGTQPRNPPTGWPPTLLAGQATAGIDGLNVEGYRNYVGQTVVGGWRWLPDLNIGIAVEQDYAAAFGAATLVRNSLLAMTLVFSLGLIALTLAAGLGSLTRRRFRDLSEVGPYQVQELLGEGGMGRVYLAEHALLCRQSAVKVLTGGENDLSVVSRFEREVQLASQLTHPNTIAIYDFGRNNDGLFYYAMEYINGAHLGQLVEYSGAIEPGRCIWILRQLCCALSEAHQAGVVHRDIKPQNIMVCNRGGEPDFVKLFDYGLVKAFAPGVSHTSAQTKIVVGTPRFMAPERLNSPWLADPRVDIYSVGALAYFLLTAQLPPLVTSGSGLDDEHTGVETLDLPPSVVEFGGILSDCMSVEPSLRPSSMSSLMRELDELSKKFPWNREESVKWWVKHEPKLLNLVKTKRKKLKT